LGEFEDAVAVKEATIMRKAGLVLVIFGSLSMLSIVSAVSTPEDGEWIPLIRQGMEGWQSNPGTWMNVGEATAAPDGLKRIDVKPGAGILVNGPDGNTQNLFSNLEHGDVEAKIEFMVPPGSNSGVYFQGRYEIQILDSWGVLEPGYGDCGGIYQRWKDDNGYEGHSPRVNASLKPGEWQTLDVVFHAPRFDAKGKKLKNAEFVKVLLNGKVLHENVEVTGPTRASAFDDEQPKGPLMIQGDHGPVALRKFEVRPLKDGEWIQLFNGKDLTGWTPKINGYDLGENYGETFRVEDGSLRVCYDQYKQFDERFGHLFYDGVFSNYKIRVEYRFIGDQVPGGPDWAFRNSGIMIHGQSPESMEKDQDFPVSIEVQTLGGRGEGKGERTTANLCTPGTNVVMNGDLFTPHCVNSNSKTYHGDQWVTVEIEVHGNGVIHHIIDGEVVLEYEKPQLDPKDPDAKHLIRDGNLMLSEGTISLQSESHPVEFRKVEILLLDE
jgi:hypothetical protein